MATKHADVVIDTLWRNDPDQVDQEMYTILDGARDDQIYPHVAECALPYHCLYRGDAAEELAEVAPYLVHLQRDAPFTDWLISQGWGESWGVFIQSAATLAELRRHFRRFMMVHDESGTPLYFRYYDPRVLRVYLPTCTAEELQVIFGPVTRYALEDKDPGYMLEYGCRRGTLTQRRVELVSGAHQLASGVGSRS